MCEHCILSFDTTILAKENNKHTDKKHICEAQVVGIKLQTKRKEIGAIKHARGPATRRPPCHVQDCYTNTSCSLNPEPSQPITAPIPKTNCLLSAICPSRTQIINAKNSDPCLPITTYPLASIQLGRIAPAEWNPINTFQKNRAESSGPLRKRSARIKLFVER